MSEMRGCEGGLLLVGIDCSSFAGFCFYAANSMESGSPLPSARPEVSFVQSTAQYDAISLSDFDNKGRHDREPNPE